MEGSSTLNLKGDKTYLSIATMKITADEGRFAFGSGYWNYSVKLMIPSVLFPYKKSLLFKDVYAGFGENTKVSVGATTDGFSDAYVEFGYLSFVVWTMIFAVISLIKNAAISSKKDSTIILYLLAFPSIIWMFSHGTRNAIGNTIFLFIIVAISLMFISRVK
jgi:hypothetical protein